MAHVCVDICLITISCLTGSRNDGHVGFVDLVQFAVRRMWCFLVWQMTHEWVVVRTGQCVVLYSPFGTESVELKVIDV